MDSKRGLINFAFIFVFAIILIGLISSAPVTCSIQSSCNAANTVMKLSATTNAHGEVYSGSAYNQYLCCNVTGIHTCSGANTVIKLSATTNAHAQTATFTGYSTSICFGTLECVSGSSCSSGYSPVISLSATTNAHIGLFSTYGTKICCRDNPASVCGNGFVESGEACDDHNTANGDCCNSNCQYEASGSSCTTDNNACTTDVCNSAGTCLHNAITCNDGSLCTTDSCNTATGCVYTPITCNDGNVCTSDSCNALTGCQYTNLAYGTACTSDGNACTLDICSSGSCTHPSISNCCNNNAECGPSGFCPQDYCNLSDHKCYDRYPSCTNNDGCCPSGCNMGNDNDCTTCTLDSQCTNSPGPCNPGDCVGGVCTYPSITSCTNNDGCCPSGCTSLNDNNCVATCGNGVRENPPEQCDGSQLGGATCASLLGSGYTGTLTCYASGTPDQCEYNTAGCIPPCDLTSASWSVSTPVGSSIVEGTTVSLNIAGTNCGGKTIIFDIREEDSIGSQDVTPDPANIVFPSSGTTASRSWVSVFQDDGLFEGNPPEYYFIATVSGTSETRESPNSGVNDAGLLRVSELVTCGNGAIDPPSEECDEGANNGDVCSPPYGGTCSYCSDSCATVTLDGAYCGDNNCDAGNEDCSSCSADCGACPSTCTILDAYWNVSQVVEGAPVRLNVEASNCGGETVTFEVFEDDNTGDDDITSAGGTNPSSINFPSSGSLGFVDWNAFYMEDNEIGQSYPPEFYFTATILTEEMDSDLLEVLNAGACAGITYCADYTTQETCDPDACEAGENEPTCDETPIYDPITRCTVTPECDCQWDTDTLTCEPETILDDPVCDSLNCGNGRLDAGEICDEAFLQLSDNSCTHFDEYTTGTVSCYPAGSPYECTYNFEDCGPQSCGNGVREVGEECDDWNNVNGDGCDENCLNEDAPYCGDGIVNQASEVCDIPSLQLTDDSCTHFDAYTSGLVDCYAAGTTYECTYDFSDCANQECGNGVVDGTEECEPPSLNGCDASCMWEGGPAIDPPNVGQCAYTTSGSETCASGVTLIERTVVGIMIWDILNNFPSVPAWGVEGVNIFFRDGAYRYDPSDQYTNCITPTTQSIQCPSMVELPFFGWYQVIVVVAVVGLIYLIYVLRKNNSKKPVKKYKKRK